MLYKCLVLPLIDYGGVLYHCANQDNLSQLQVIQNKCIKIILRLDPRAPTDLIHNESAFFTASLQMYERVCPEIFLG